MVVEDSLAEVGELLINSSIVDRIGEVRLIPVLRLGSSRDCTEAARDILESGWPVVEIAATTPDWREALKTIRTEFPDALVGVGTIMTVDDAAFSVDFGAEFLVSPHLSPTLRSRFGTYLIEGGLTPGEVYAAGKFGLAKLFPAHVGGTKYLRSLLAVYPDLNIMPTGGLALAEAASWLDAGAFAVGIGSGLFGVPNPAEALRGALENVPAK